MIIVKLKGGLGNQLFQYACARAMSLRHNNTLKLDITGYGAHETGDVSRHYSLSPFNIQATVATPKEVKKLKYPYGIISKGWRFLKAKVLQQLNVCFNPKVFGTQGSLYLDGYFQTEKYFIDAKNEIRQDLTLKGPLNSTSLTVLKMINSASRSISLHIRRGDYVSDTKAFKHHGTCNIDYYKNATNYMVSKIGSNIHLFVFSDDIEWARRNLITQHNTIFVSNGLIPDYEELYLMSKCSHNIISNSTFSWWSAWLNTNPDKIVIAPKKWSVTNSRIYTDIIPESWIRI